MNWPRRSSWLTRLLSWQLTSRWYCIALLLGLWSAVYLLGNWRPLLHQLARGDFANILVHVELSLLFGWVILPCSLLHLMTGVSDASLLAWISLFILGYDVTLLTLQGLFLRYRTVWLLLPVLVVASVSVAGCESYMATVQWH